MARKLFSNTAEVNEAEVTESNDTQESSVMSTATEEVAPEATDESAVAPAQVTEAPAESTEAEAKPELDMGPFEAAVAAAIEQRDESTGTIPEAFTAPVTQAYRDLPVGGKSKAKAYLIQVMTEGVESDNINKAMAASQLQKVLTPAKSSGSSKPKAEATPVDPNEAVATQVAPLRAAYGYLLENLPEGAELDAVKAKTVELSDAASEQLQSYLDWKNREAPAEGEEDTPEPEVSDVTKKAAQLILRKVRVASSSGGGGPRYSGPRRDIQVHFDQVFASKASGDFMSITEIANADSAEYGEDHPSSGAVSARLFPKEGTCSLKGVTPGTNAEGKRGAFKV